MAKDPTNLPCVVNTVVQLSCPEDFKERFNGPSQYHAFGHFLRTSLLADLEALIFTNGQQEYVLRAAQAFEQACMDVAIPRNRKEINANLRIWWIEKPKDEYTANLVKGRLGQEIKGWVASHGPDMFRFFSQNSWDTLIRGDGSVQVHMTDEKLWVVLHPQKIDEIWLALEAFLDEVLNPYEAKTV